MNSAERVDTALRNRQPDRVPVMEFVIDEGVAAAIAPGCTDTSDCLNRLGMDGVGCSANFARTSANADGTFVDEWGVTYGPGPETLAHPIRGPIATLDDARAYVPPDPDAPNRVGGLEDIVARYKGDRAICFHHRAAFMWAAYLMGLESLLVAFLERPDMAELVMDKVLEANMAVARRAISAGAEVVLLGDDYADNRGPMMSPAMFDRFIFPRLKQMVDMVHDEGALCVKHTDGNIYPILESIVRAGPDGVHPIEPAAGMELREVKRLIGDRVAIAGNIDCGELLSNGSVEDVRDAVRKAIGDAAGGGGYVLTSSNSIHSSCKAENVVAMVEACKEFGEY